MKRLEMYKSILKYLTDKDLSLSAKGFLSIVLFNYEITPEDVKKYCSDDEETIKDVLLELKITKYIKRDTETNTLLAGPEPYTNWNLAITQDLQRRAKKKAERER